MTEIYRPCVAAILQHEDGRILVAERRDFANSWQFPQGGQDEGENSLEALHRELYEELSVLPESYTVLEQRAGYRYRFPSRHWRRGKYVGQEQTYFLCRFHGQDSIVNLQTKQPEFRSWKWITPAEFQMSWLPEFKRAVYRAVLLDFFGVSK
jgi:putative (di)nucleoside polyphosphate hydrolase